MSRDLSWPLARSARLRPGVTAVADATRSVTYSELQDRLASLGGALERLGVAPTERVGMLAFNSLAHVECFLGVPQNGRVFVSLNFRLAQDELAALVDDAEIRLLVTDVDHLDVATRLLERCPSLRTLVVDGDAPEAGVPYEDLVAGPASTAPELDGSALAVISYTGGTTGIPKGVMLTHENLLANAFHNLAATRFAQDDRWLLVCPMFHVAGVSTLVAAVWVGASLVVLPRFDAESVLATIERERITHVELVPTMLGLLLEHPGFAAANLSSLRHVQYAASPISPELQARVVDALPCDVTQFYGMTEAAPTVSRLSPDDHRRGAAGEEPYATRLRSAGAPVVGVQVGVRDAAGEPLGAGAIGEVWVRGPNVMAGYWRRPEATEAALVDAWYRTGDAGFLDDDGYLYLVDRLRDMIVTGGENVYSMEVELALQSHPAVREAAVFGIPDDRWGEAVHAVVVVDGAATVPPEELQEHCRTRIAGFKVPREIDVTETPLPRSGAGKLLKNTLREPFWKDRERRIS